MNMKVFGCTVGAALLVGGPWCALAVGAVILLVVK